MNKTYGSAREFLAAMLRCTNPELSADDEAPAGTRVLDNIRVQLKADFQGVEFGVLSSGRADAETLVLRWRDGPRESDVMDSLALYMAGGAEGAAGSGKTVWQETFGVVAGLRSDRSYSDEAIQEAIDVLTYRYGDAFGWVRATPEKWRNGALQGSMLKLVQGYGMSAQTGLSAFLCNRSWPAPAHREQR